LVICQRGHGQVAIGITLSKLLWCFQKGFPRLALFRCFDDQKKDAKALETTFFRQNLETSVFVAGRKNSPLIKPP